MTIQQLPDASPRWSSGSTERRWLLVALVAVLVCAVGGYALGQRNPVLLSTQARCDLGTSSISCQPIDDDGSPDHDGWTYSVPLDVAWSGSGYAHEGGRPECLPPTGGLSGVVGLGWVEVATDGGSRRQVVSVTC